ncbi:MAG: carbohydrate kinase family protein, partial [Nitrososphaerales archaeon]
VYPRVIYLSGHSLVNENLTEVLNYALKRANEMGIKVVFDCTPHNQVSKKRELFRSFAKRADCLCLNLMEAYALTGARNPKTALSILSSIIGFVALKMGKAGCIVTRENQIVKIEAPKVRMVDSTGAGDAFAASVAYGIAHDLFLGDIARLAVKASSAKVQYRGPRLPATWMMRSGKQDK